MTRSTQNKDMNHDPSNRKPRQNPNQREDVLFAGWADFNFSAEQRGAFEEWVAENNWGTTLDLSLKDDLKITLSYNAEQDTYLATAFVKAHDSPNAGMMTSQRSADALRAVCKLLWAVNFGMGTDWEAHSSAASRNW